MAEKQVVIIGAGPAGLTAAYELTKCDVQPRVLEKLNKVGGISRTENYRGYHFDLGGHRFFTKSDEVNAMWHEVLGNDFLLRPRLSRIYYNNKFFHYPLKPFNALFGLGVWQAILVALSFLRWQIWPYPREETFEEWVTNRFGKRLFEIFFKTYTEKVWGVPTSELKAEFAAQRIKGLSLKTALLSMFFKPKDKIKTLIEEFWYPRCGPGMFWEAVRREVERRNGIVELNSEVVRVHRSGNRIQNIVARCDGRTEEIIPGTDFISSMPLAELIHKMDPVPPQVLQAAKEISYRDYLTVCLIVNKPHLFPDNWIYVHAPEVKVGRIQNYKNWSPAMVPDSSKSSLGMEYFCAEGDMLWNLPDDELVELAKKEIDRIGLARYQDVEDGCVVRVPKAYPVYDSAYHDYLEVIKKFIGQLENLQTIGRNGLHRYDNQDHAMMTGILAARNVMWGEHNDLWSINTDGEYQEEIREATPEENAEMEQVLEGALTRVFNRLDPVAFGVSLGTVAGVSLLVATLFLIIKGGPLVGRNLQLLNQFIPGYEVTLTGSLIGMVGAFVVAFVAGWAIAFLRNAVVFLNAILIRRDLELDLLSRILDYV